MLHYWLFYVSDYNYFSDSVTPDLPLLFLPRGVEQQVSVPVILLDHVLLQTISVIIIIILHLHRPRAAPVLLRVCARSVGHSLLI